MSTPAPVPEALRYFASKVDAIIKGQVRRDLEAIWPGGQWCPLEFWSRNGIGKVQVSYVQSITKIWLAMDSELTKLWMPGSDDGFLYAAVHAKVQAGPAAYAKSRPAKRSRGNVIEVGSDDEDAPTESQRHSTLQNLRSGRELTSSDITTCMHLLDVKAGWAWFEAGYPASFRIVADKPTAKNMLFFINHQQRWSLP
ncbi:hypothetical protein G7046_g828 [Stylonectria norvegica]|nr:hypothetical protein G7046_g828 [Stylonectria norvegica]